MKSLIILAIVFCPVFAFPGALRKKSKKPARISQDTEQARLIDTRARQQEARKTFENQGIRVIGRNSQGELILESDKARAQRERRKALIERQKALMKDNQAFVNRKKQAMAFNIDPVTKTSGGGGRDISKVGGGGGGGGRDKVGGGGPDGCRYKWIYPLMTPNNPVKVCTWPQISSSYFETSPSSHAGGNSGIFGAKCKPVKGIPMKMGCTRTSTRSSSNYYKEINPKTGKPFPKGLQWDPKVKTGGGAVR